MANDPHQRTSLVLDIPKDALAPGEVFFLNNSGVGPVGSSTAADNNSGKSQLLPLSTLAGAIDKCLAGRGDNIIIMPGHSETVTAQIDLDVAGISIIGVGNGSLKPQFIGNGAIDLFDISAANIKLENIDCGAPLTDAQTSFINVDAAGAQLINISGIGSVATENVVDCITITANADDLIIDGLRLINKVVAVNSFISLEGAASNVYLRNIDCFGDCVTAGIIDAAKIDYLFMDNVRIATVGTTIAAVILDSNPEGIATNCYFAGTSTTLADNAQMGNLMRLGQLWVTEQTDGTAQMARIPAVDAD